MIKVFASLRLFYPSYLCSLSWFFFSSRRRHTRFKCDWSSDVCSSDLVRDAMSTVVLTIGPAHTLRQAAALMSARRVGAAVVHDPDAGGIGILTERDILNAV